MAALIVLSGELTKLTRTKTSASQSYCLPQPLYLKCSCLSFRACPDYWPKLPACWKPCHWGSTYHSLLGVQILLPQLLIALGVESSFPFLPPVLFGVPSLAQLNPWCLTLGDVGVLPPSQHCWWCRYLQRWLVLLRWRIWPQFLRWHICCCSLCLMAMACWTAWLWIKGRSFTLSSGGTTLHFKPVAPTVWWSEGVGGLDPEAVSPLLY